MSTGSGALGKHFLSRETSSMTSFSILASFIMHLMFFSSLTVTRSMKGIFDVLILPICILHSFTMGSYAKTAYGKTLEMRETVNHKKLKKIRLLSHDGLLVGLEAESSSNYCSD